MRLAIHQPNFFTRLKVLQKIAAADVWVVLDDAQYSAREWQNRTLIVPTHGSKRPFWLTLPVPRTRRERLLICDTAPLDPSQLGAYVTGSLWHALHSGHYWNEAEEIIQSCSLDNSLRSLIDVGIRTTQSPLQHCGINPKIILSSTLRAGGTGSSWMASICRELGASTYLADSGARNYLDLEDFEDIDVLWQNWHEPAERWDEIASWQNVSYLNFVARAGLDCLHEHLLSCSFIRE